MGLNIGGGGGERVVKDGLFKLCMWFQYAARAKNHVHMPQFCWGHFDAPKGSLPEPLGYGTCFLSCINIFLSPARETGNQACVPICKPKVGHPKGRRQSLILGAGKIVWLLVSEWGRNQFFKKIYQPSFLDLRNGWTPFCRIIMFGHWDQRVYFDYLSSLCVFHATEWALMPGRPRQEWHP